MNKQKWLDLAEIIDAWRIMPRIIWALSFCGYCWFAYDSVVWIKDVYATKGTVDMTVAGYVGTTLTTLGGVLTFITNFYMKNGRDWKSEANNGL